MESVENVGQVQIEGRQLCEVLCLGSHALSAHWANPIFSVWRLLIISPLLTPAVRAHHLSLTVVTEERWSAADGRTKQHEDYEVSEALPAALPVPFQQSAAGHEAQLKVKLCLVTRSDVAVSEQVEDIHLSCCQWWQISGS